MRSSDTIDASALAARTYGGGGHPRAAGFRVPRFENFELQVLECVQTLKQGMQRQRAEKEQSNHQQQIPVQPAVQNTVSQEVPLQAVSSSTPGVDVVERVGDEGNMAASGGTDVVSGLMG